MSNRTTVMTDALYDYVQSTSLRESEILRRLRDATKVLDEHTMQIAPEQGQFMAFLVRLMGARQCLEIGTFTGYSALAVAMALPDDGRLVACDLSRDYTRIGEPFWKEAGVDARIDLRIGPALETLDALIAAGGSGQFDFAFIDADKTQYADYVERCHSLIRTGGIIAVDNVLWHGAVADPERSDEDTEAIRALNSALGRDQRFDLSLVPIGDGLTLLRVR